MKSCITDERISYKCERALMKEGFKIIKLPPSKNISTALASHPDMIMFSHGKSIITSAEYSESHPYIFSDIREYTQNEKITFTSDIHKSKYPYDAIFNALVIDDMIFLKADTVSQNIIDYAVECGLKIINTNQGYPACTTLAFGKNAVTADKGMSKILKANGICVTDIQNGGISLPPYEYGFIGGASGVYGDKVYFLGDISRHPSADIITNSIINAGYTPCSLSDEELCDLGGIIFP